MTEVFEMDLWQLLCYIEGYNRKLAQIKISNVELAVLTGQYTGQYFTGKRATDPKKIINDILNSLSQSVSDNNIEEAENKIKELKKQLKMFK